MYIGKHKKLEEAGRRDMDLTGSTLGGTTGKPEAEEQHIWYEL